MIIIKFTKFNKTNFPEFLTLFKYTYLYDPT